MWRSVVSQVINLHETGHTPFRDDYHGDYGLAALMPRAASEISFLYRELAGDPIAWWQPLSWQATVERWLPLSQGNPPCVDHLIAFFRPLPPEDQARAGLPWIASLVPASPIESRTAHSCCRRG